MFNEYVWFENSMAGVNLGRTTDFALLEHSNGSHLQFYQDGLVVRRITDRADIINFFENIARVPIPHVLGSEPTAEIKLQVALETIEEQKQEIADLERAAFP